MTTSLSTPDITADAAIPLCRNCGREVAGAFCSGCGQKRIERELTLRELFADIVGEFIAWDSKLLRSIRPLLFRPGFLTNEYLAGHRTRYILPTRLYIVISVVTFFLLLGLGPLLTTALGPEVIADIAREHRMSVVEAGEELSDRFRATLPWVIVLSVPIFALMLKLLYSRRQRLFVEHLIFSIHFYSFSLFSLVPLALSVVFGEIGPLVISLLFLLYLLAAVRRVYRQGWGRTILKTLVLATVYGTLFLLNIMLAMQIALALL